jgi:hypothetical protein
MVRSWLIDASLKLSELFARAAFKLEGQTSFRREPPGDILPDVELSPKAVEMRVDLQRPLPQRNPEKPKPLEGSIEERLRRVKGDWD